ncbi:holin-like protein [Bosea sp. OAE506]|jgi:holin-like protein|uniref:CidA/LrgA family protein n=1 Tax=Bosea sp. OAE506 TaxID=2663870 RepID=UPI00178B5D40
MILALTLLLACQLAGEALARLFALPVPGPVIGLALLFLGLRWRPSAALEGAPLATVAGVLLAHLSLLFVPAGTGIVRHAGSLLAHGPGLIAALLVSTALTLAVTAFVFVKVAALVDSRPDPNP